MNNTGYKRLFKLVLTLVLTGCAGNPPVKTDAPYRNNSAGTTHSTGTVLNHPPEYQTQSLGLTGTYANSLAVKNFIRHMVLEHHFSESYLNNLFS
ncbi:MAG: lytic murein transglycosylase, partial [Methylobacter sp.]